MSRYDSTGVVWLLNAIAQYAGWHGESPLGKASKSSLHVMRRYLKASHMCAIVQCHEASLGA